MQAECEDGENQDELMVVVKPSSPNMARRHSILHKEDIQGAARAMTRLNFL